MAAVKALLVIFLVLVGCGRIGFDARDELEPGFTGNLPVFEGGVRLRPVVYDLGDGHDQFVRWYDSDLDTECVIDRERVAADGEVRCMPYGANVVYSDTGCTQPIGLWRNLGERQPRWALSNTPIVGCTPGTQRAFPIVGPVAAPASYYRAEMGGCFATGIAMNEQFFSIGSETSPHTFVRAVEYELGTARIRGRGMRADDGALHVSGLFDSTLGFDCQILDTPLGPQCLPTATGGGVVFMDAACTMPVTNVFSPCPGNHVTTYNTGACGPSAVVAGELYSGTLYRHDGAMACVLYGEGTALIGDELNPNMLAVGETISMPPAGRLAARGWFDSEGTFVHQGWYDSARSGDCSVSYTGNYAPPLRHHCVPPHDFASNTWADTACTLPAKQLLDTTCPVQPYLMTLSPLDPRGPVFARVTLSSTTTAVSYTYALSGGPCLMLPMSPFPLALATEPVSFDSFVAATLVVQ